MTSKVLEPNIKDLISADQDITFFEGQVKKILDNTLRIYKRNLTFVGILEIIFGFAWLLLYYIFFIIGFAPIISPIVFIIIGLSYFFSSLISLVFSGAIFNYIPSKEVRNVRDWKKFLESKEAISMGTESRGRLDILMRMVASMGGWLYAEKLVRGGTPSVMVMPIMTVFFLLSFFPWSNMMVNVLLVIFPTLFIGVFVGWITRYYIIHVRYREKQEYWGPRLMTYRVRLEGYWRSL
jgi:hypothetical protein